MLSTNQYSRAEGGISASKSIPVVSQYDAEVSPSERDRIAVLAARLLADEPALSDTHVFGPRVRSGLDDGPSLCFEDHSQVSLFSVTEDTPLEYRTLLLAGDGDFMVIGGPRFLDFEAYCRNSLRLGHVEVRSPHKSTTGKFVPTSKRCIADRRLFEEICELAAEHGRLNIVPYIGTGNAWELAGRISSCIETPVCVAAPPPRLTRRVNDKLWFTARVRDVLNRQASPLTYSVFGPAALAARVASLATRHPLVVIKVPDSAGSLGNLVFRSPDIDGLPLHALRQRIVDILAERGWLGGYPLIVGVWDQPVIASPSVNIWIPRPENGTPIIEGIFTQTLSGDEGEFIGAEPSELPYAMWQRLTHESAMLACLLQELGYFGRCGFDAVLVGDSLDGADVHWVECNGRWGGVSIPITLANRLVGNWRRRSVVIVQRTKLEMPPRSFASVLEILEDRLLRRPSNATGVVLLTPGRVVDGSGLNLMVLAETKAAASTEAQSVAVLLQSSMAA